MRTCDRPSAAAVDCGLGPASAHTVLDFLGMHPPPALQDKKENENDPGFESDSGFADNQEMQSMTLGIFI